MNDKVTQTVEISPPLPWTKTIRPVSGWFDIHLGELWRYRDLIMLFVRRDFVAIYKQTILGPLWYLLQPIMTTLVFTLVFSRVARLPTDGIPPVIFYLSGVIAWRYFADCLQRTSNTFAGNAAIFGKVYFPRLTVPLSVVISSLIAFGIQLLLFAGCWLYFVTQGAAIYLHPAALLLPLMVLQMAILGLGCGIIVSALTTKYRDLAQLVGFGVQLWMYATPIVYPASMVPPEYRWILILNPMVPIIEMFRFAFLGKGTVDIINILTGWGMTAAVLIVGIVLFSRIEKSFMDTV